MGNLKLTLWGTVATLGLAASAVGSASRLIPSYSARLAALAAVVAIIELLPDRGGRGWLVAALAVAGSVDATCSWVVMHQTGWGEPVILAISVVQSVAAVAALLADATPRATRADSDAAQAAYLAYVQAYYYAAQFQSFPSPSGGAEQASGWGRSAAGESQNDGHAGADDTAVADLHAKYGRFRPSHDGSGAQSPEVDRRAEYAGMPGADAQRRGPRSVGGANTSHAPWEPDRRSLPPT